MKAYGVIELKQNRLIVLKRNWIENAAIGAKTRVFFSPNENRNPNFTTEPKYLFDPNSSECYEGVVIKFFDNHDNAAKFIEWKRPRFHYGSLHTDKYCFDAPNIVAKINLMVNKSFIIILHRS